LAEGALNVAFPRRRIGNREDTFTDSEDRVLGKLTRLPVKSLGYLWVFELKPQSPSVVGLVPHVHDGHQVGLVNVARNFHRLTRHRHPSCSHRHHLCSPFRFVCVHSLKACWNNAYALAPLHAYTLTCLSDFLDDLVDVHADGAFDDASPAANAHVSPVGLKEIGELVQNPLPVAVGLCWARVVT